jgi:hypothetical protein
MVAVMGNPGFVPYDANAHGLIHPPDWTIHPGEDETPEEVDVIKGLEFFLTSDFDNHDKFSVGVQCLNPEQAPRTPSSRPRSDSLLLPAHEDDA